MDKYWICDLKLTLEQIVLRKVGVFLWTDPNILDSFQNLPYELSLDDECECRWRDEVEDKVKEKISKLKLPKTMLEQLMGIVKPIGLEILRWKIFHEKFLEISYGSLDIRVLEHLIWTPGGWVDYRKTAHDIIRLETLTIIKRYELACLYCLEEDIIATWKALSDRCLQNFCKYKSPLPVNKFQMELYFAYIFKIKGTDKEFTNLSYFYERAFEISALQGNKEAVNHFFQKMTNEERDSCVVRVATRVLAYRCRKSDRSRYAFPKHKHSDVLCYLFYQMTPEQQRTICSEWPFLFLSVFLDLQWQHLLADITALVFAFPLENRYQYFMNFITSHFSHGRRYCSVFFQKVFPLTPLDFRKYCVDRECNSGFLFSQVSYITTETVQAIFRSVDNEDKVRLVSCEYFFQFVDHLILTDRWGIVELCLKEAALSKEGRDRVKEAYTGFFRENGIGQQDVRQEHWKRVLAFLDEMDAKSPN